MSLSVVILAGGSGSRLWPLSRSMHPKQFLNINEEKSMLQNTIDRLDELDIESINIIANRDHRFILKDQIKGLKTPVNIILEPCARNTAAAICLAALNIGDNKQMLVLSSDHYIEDKKIFTSAVNKGVELLDYGKMVIFGAKPSSAHTGYGYIKIGEEKNNFNEVNKFIEKPDKKDAKVFYDSGHYLWNTGMFMFNSTKYLEELEKFSIDTLKGCRNSISEIKDCYEYLEVDETHFKKCPNISVDYAIMEKTKDVAVIKLKTAWADLGSWSSLWDSSKKDSDMNHIQGDVISRETSNSYISSHNKLVVSLGIDNLIVISTKDAVMVADKDNVEDIKDIFNSLRDADRTEWEFHREVYRPWGKFDSLDIGKNYQVKKITVKPGEKLSMQYHHHRSEHWVVVSGTATVTKGDETFDLEENQSTYINVEEIHALENKRDIDLEIIEVQTGNYLGEDDIVRIEDKYDRK